MLRQSSIFALALLATTLLHAQDKVPAGAPTVDCNVPPQHDASKLLVLKGDAPVDYIFACGFNRPAGQCAVMTGKPGDNDFPITARFSTAGQQQNGWLCVAPNDSTSGWMRADRLAPLPPTPAITTTQWLGAWRQGPDERGIHNDRLVITRSTTPKTLHVKGEAYWYGLNKDPNTGGVDADASAYGDTLHIVDGTDEFACVLDLVYQPQTSNFTAADNHRCGGMNVSFSGEWQRFTPRPTKSH